MSFFPKKNFFCAFDTLVPSRYLLKFRKMVFFEPFMGNDIANRGRLSHYGCPERKEFAKDLKKIRSETELLLEDIEAYHIFMAVKRTRKVPGTSLKSVFIKGVRQRSSARQKGTSISTSSTRLKACRRSRISTWSGRSMKVSLPRLTTA